jgi:hypothetical protein
MSQTISEGELEKLLDTLTKFGVNYFYSCKQKELLIEGKLLIYEGNYISLDYDELDIMVYQNTDSVTIKLYNRQSWQSGEIVIPVPAKKVYYIKPYLRIRFQT